jgi:hypothetical protein
MRFQQLLPYCPSPKDNTERQEEERAFRIAKKRRRAYWSQISRTGLLSPHADQAKQIVKTRVNPKRIEPRIALSKAG